MFDFLKPEVSGLKNVLNYYFAYLKNMPNSSELTPEQMNDFTAWYFSIRLGQPLFSESKSIELTSKAWRIIASRQQNKMVPRILLSEILFGLLEAENQLPKVIDMDAIQKTLKKFPPISSKVSGF